MRFASGKTFCPSCWACLHLKGKAPKAKRAEIRVLGIAEGKSEKAEEENREEIKMQKEPKRSPGAGSGKQGRTMAPKSRAAGRSSGRSRSGGYPQSGHKGRNATAVLAVVLILVLVWIEPAFLGDLYEFLGIRPSLAAVAGEVQSDTKVHIIDVGQGDAALLEQDGQFALIDAGPPDGVDNLIAYMDGLDVTRLEYLIMTHPHSDHYGGMTKVLNRYVVGRMILPDFEKAPYPTAQQFQDILQTLLDKDVPTTQAKQGDIYPLGRGSIVVLHAGLKTLDNYNLLSLGLLFEAEGFRFVNTGDAEKPNEEAMLQSGESLQADVFLAGHHGSSTSNTAAFVNAVRPSLVVVSCGKGNSYGHPHRETLATVNGLGATLLRTDQNGCVVVGPGAEGELAYAATHLEAA